MADLELTPLDEAEPKPPVNLLGGQTSQQALASRDAMAELDESTSFVKDALPAAFQQNLGPQMWKTLDSKFSNAPEEGFDPQAWLAENPEQVPADMHDKFSGVRSTAEAAELRDRINDDIQNTQILQAKGARGIAATLLAGVVDVDAPLALVTGGTAKAVTLGGRVARGAAAGAATGAAIEAGHVIVDPLAETSDIINGALFGTVLGGAAGAVFNRSVASVRDEFNEAAPHLGDADDFEYPKFVDSNWSVGAAYTPNRPTEITEGLSDSQLREFDDAQYTLDTEASYTGATVKDLMGGMEGATGYTAKAGRLLAENIAKTPGLRSLFDDVASGGTIMKAMAYDLLESPAGRVRNNLSASATMDRYERVLATELLPIDNAYASWHKQSGNTRWQDMSGQSRKAFDRAVLDEMNNRTHKGPLSDDPLVKQAADALDAHYARDRELKQGRDGETAVDGAMELNETSGHYTRSWDGKAMREKMRTGTTRKQIEEMIANAYTKMHPQLKAEGHDMVVAKAIVRRALSQEDGVDSNMLQTMNSDGIEFLKQTLEDSGFTGEQFDGLLRTLTGKAEERGMLSSNKARIELDMRTSEGDLSMMDLINTDITAMTQRNTRKTAGAAALARKGIANKAQQKAMIDSAIAEAAATGDIQGAKHRETLENMFTYFDGGAIAGGVHPMISRMKRLTNLALLNQMGMTQLGETGAQMAAVGMSTWKRHAKDVFNTLEAEGPHGQLAKELRPFLGQLGDDHLLFRPELQLDELRNDTGFAAELDGFLSKLDFALGKGQRLQGYISGFYQVKSMQQKIAVTSMADKAFQLIRKGEGVQQLQDIGIDMTHFQKYLDKVEFSEDGYVNRLNMDQWDVEDADAFATALNRYTHQVVQKGLIGEDSQWWHSSWGAIFSHLKTFPLMAMQKQAARNMNMGTPAAVAMVSMGLATAGLAYSAKQVVNNKDVPAPADIAKGAFGMSNMTGWFPMFFDPAAAMLGMNDLRFNQYGRTSASSGILSTPPAIPTLNRMLHIPGALNPIGDMSRNDRIRALQAAPLVGNAFGMTAIWNAMKN
jgi:hypothetical protein